jgi:hypothetical protein
MEKYRSPDDNETIQEQHRESDVYHENFPP